ncbi:putative RNA polymerase II subunit B1 CTD phosphatase RPAP2 homolog isoform X1 [Lotus japonicus]|uniref:putative RNA polymerase II subunit B1 CTD phosphatase RPAP2 homolog isoform X1 n=1 Tax=Lotus japonicus TaxID=34305 RepID=UPI002586FA72|nr:putative RNA polymerase II subunit B1 CTD phosphatase RPAP2 homolog isoform X1 [Lotus japonicus]XP_057451590.1 putative RNA polymerase II subunit B1 CTD phosphatase RPAP2 homolog isoform X1 [Lotus japonicus]
MAKDQPVFVKDAVLKLQLSLFEGIRSEDQLFAAGSLISRSDYEDVVTERSITNVCGYPLCQNGLPSDRPRKGRYRISLKEHKVYDLHETYMFCSSTCVVNGKAFAGTLQDERCPTVDPEKLNDVLRLFENLNAEPVEDLGKGGDLGLSGLRIQEKTESSTGEVSLDQWLGPSNAIEGYVPKQRKSDSKSSQKNIKKGSKASRGRLNDEKKSIYSEMDFMSTIITQDEYSVSKVSSGQTDITADQQIKPVAKLEVPKKADKVSKDDDSVQDLSSSFKSSLNLSTSEKEKEIDKSDEPVIKSSLNPSVEKIAVHSSTMSEILDVEQNISERKSIQLQGETSRVAANQNASTSSLDPVNVEGEFQIEKETGSYKTRPKSSLKSTGKKKLSRSVTWADEKTNSSGSKDLCSVREFGDGDIKKESDLEGNIDVTDDDEDMIRRASAEACAIALSQASEAVASGDSDITDAVSEAGIIILPSSHDVVEEGTMEDVDIPETDGVTLKWPRKPGISDFDLFDSEDSWHDPPPEGFSLTLSPFASMWNALFSWTTSSSLAYIYGRDVSFHEDFLSVNGREYPCKIILTDGRSSEIKQTLASCLARALPAVVAELRLPIPVSTLEQGMVCLLDTMSFVDALPAFRMKQWQVVVLLFIDALSICRIPALISYMMDRRDLFHKVLNGSQLGMEEYEVLKDLIIPLGKAPHFSSQRGA